jgi:hypothetical protein
MPGVVVRPKQKVMRKLSEPKLDLAQYMEYWQEGSAKNQYKSRRKRRER